MTVLHVEDQPVIREVVRRALEPSGFTIVSVEGVGAAKLALAERDDVTSALLAIRLRDGSGLDLYDWIGVHHPALAPASRSLPAARTRRHSSRSPRSAAPSSRSHSRSPTSGVWWRSGRASLTPARGEGADSTYHHRCDRRNHAAFPAKSGGRQCGSNCSTVSDR
jgi:hypothetical protein